MNSGRSSCCDGLRSLSWPHGPVRPATPAITGPSRRGRHRWTGTSCSEAARSSTTAAPETDFGARSLSPLSAASSFHQVVENSAGWQCRPGRISVRRPGRSSGCGSSRAGRSAGMRSAPARMRPRFAERGVAIGVAHPNCTVPSISVMLARRAPPGSAHAVLADRRGSRTAVEQQCAGRCPWLREHLARQIADSAIRRSSAHVEGAADATADGGWRPRCGRCRRIRIAFAEPGSCCCRARMRAKPIGSRRRPVAFGDAKYSRLCRTTGAAGSRRGRMAAPAALFSASTERDRASRMSRMTNRHS